MGLACVTPWSSWASPGCSALTTATCCQTKPPWLQWADRAPVALSREQTGCCCCSSVSSLSGHVVAVVSGLLHDSLESAWSCSRLFFILMAAQVSSALLLPTESPSDDVLLPAVPRPTAWPLRCQAWEVQGPLLHTRLVPPPVLCMGTFVKSCRVFLSKAQRRN